MSIPASNCRTPIGARQSVGGGLNFTPCNAVYNRSAVSVSIVFSHVCPLSFVPFTLAFAHTSPTTTGVTRLNSSFRKPPSCAAFAFFSIVRNVPSSTPYGCGRISFGSGGNDPTVRGYTTRSTSAVVRSNPVSAAFPPEAAESSPSPSPQLPCSRSALSASPSADSALFPGGTNVIEACGFAIAVCSRYSSTLALPRAYRASSSTVTLVPVPVELA
ncbi:MAG: hypothetical protein M5U20_12565 [Phycisphaerales bacterium]|nr:hypothetical protein [Phycisphaerales bacterium]